MIEIVKDQDPTDRESGECVCVSESPQNEKQRVRRNAGAGGEEREAPE